MGNTREKPIVVARELGDGIAGWAERLVTRLGGLDDAEYRWEPVSGCWSVRSQPDGTWRADLGPRGTPWTPDDPPPVTTIAWRLWHLGGTPAPAWPPTVVSSATDFARQWFTPTTTDQGVAFGTAREAVEAFAAHWDAVARLFRTFDESDDLLAPMGDMAGPYKDASTYGLLLHIADELIHHAAEIALLRDLYRAEPARAG